MINVITRLKDFFEHFLPHQHAQADNPQAQLNQENSAAIDQMLKGFDPSKATTATPSSQPTAMPTSLPTQTPTPRPSAAPATPSPSPTASPSLTPLIVSTARKYGFKPQLFQAIVQTESSGNPQAYRFEPKLNDASYGLGQILGNTAKELGLQGDPTQLYNPTTSLDYVGKYLQHKMQQFPDANFNDPLTVYRIYNTGNPNGTFAPGAEDVFRKNYGLPPTASAASPRQRALDTLSQRATDQ